MFKTKVSLVNLGLIKRYYHWFKIYADTKFLPRKKKKYGKNIRQYLIKTKTKQKCIFIYVITLIAT
jgi:hypothetical protein